MVEHHQRHPERKGIPLKVGPDDKTPVDPAPAPTDPGLAAALTQISRRLDELAEDMEEVKGNGQTAGESDERLTKVESAVRWATPWRNLAALIAFFLVGAVSVYLALRGYAQEAVIETVKAAHDGDEPLIEPSVKTVEQIKLDLGSMKGGVQCLVAAQNKEREIKELEWELEPYRDQHNDAVGRWSKKKESRRGPIPKKSDGHLALEAKLRKLTAEVDQQCEKEPP